MAIFVVVAFAIRMIPMFRFSMWVDDAATLIATDLPVDELVDQRFSRGHIPWFFVLFKGWVGLAGDSIFALRLPATIACVLSLPFIVEIARRISGPRGMFLAGLLTVFHGTLIRHSVEVRMYSWMILFSAALMWSVLWFLERPTLKRASLVGLFHLILLQLHVGSILMSVPWFVSLGVVCWTQCKDRNWIRGFLFAFLIPIILSLPVYAYLASRVDPYETEKFVRPAFSFVDYIRILYKLFLSVELYGYGAELALGCTFPLACILYLMFHKRKSGNDDQPLSPATITIWLAICVWATPTLAYIGENFGLRIMGNARYYLPATPAVVALVTGAAGSIRWQKSRSVIIANLAFMMVLYFGTKHLFYGSKKMIRSKGIGLPEMVEEVKEIVPEGTTVVIAHSRETPMLFRYYLGEDNSDRYHYVEIDRELTFDQMSEVITAQTSPDEDLLLFLYKEKSHEQKVESLVRGKFGPWGEVIQNQDKQPKWVWLKRQKAGNELVNNR